MDEFFDKYLEIANEGSKKALDFLGRVFDVVNYVAGGLLVIILFPLWLIGKISAQKSVAQKVSSKSKKVAKPARG